MKDFYMKKALHYARLAANNGEVPVGAIIVRDGEMISWGRNRREKGKNALYHAEIEAIDKACRALGGWRLPGCEMYVTLEPCPMCAGAIVNSRIEKLYIGATDEKTGAFGSVFNINDLSLNHKPCVEYGIMKEECEKILKDFFSWLRERKKREL